MFGQPAVAYCDARCDKAWGINGRPRVDLSENPDDYAYLTDDELGTAPADPGTYEGGDGKPRRRPLAHNKWCVRECERSDLRRPGEPADLSDFSRRVFNMPHLHSADAP
jgi:hypothetical protein